jgi:hypothetical protein
MRRPQMAGALRQWLHQELLAWFPTDGTYSDDARWIHWIGMTQDQYAAYRAKDPSHTSCVDFLMTVNRKINEQGYAGKERFGPFLLPTLPGYHPDDAYTPKDGDFFCTKGIYGPGSIGHVGVLMESWGWGGIKVAGGGDTKTMGYITRDSLGFPPDIMGWLDIDEFYGSSDSDDNPYVG